jgi:hypothetical protein
MPHTILTEPVRQLQVPFRFTVIEVNGAAEAAIRR